MKKHIPQFDYSNAIDIVDKTLKTEVASLQKVDLLSRQMNAVRYVDPLLPPTFPDNYYYSTDFDRLRRKYYPVTLGDNVKLHLRLFRPLAERLTFSPPAFGPTRRPGDDFTPWQCALAEEAPPLASTVYRESVDRADFDNTIDETGQLHMSTGTESMRRYFPKDEPPKALSYLKASMRALSELEQIRRTGTLTMPESDSWNYGDNGEARKQIHDADLVSARYRKTRKCDSQVALKDPITDPNLLISPVHLALSDARLERLQLEEGMLLQAEKMDQYERERGPVPKWYSLRTPQFFYEARKHNRLLMSHGRRADSIQ